MVFDKFASRARKYGIKRLLTDSDIIIAFLVWAGIGLYQVLSCGPVDSVSCTQFQNQQLVEMTTRFAFSLTALIVTGLSILIALSDDEFVADLRELGVFTNILFVFEYTLYLAAGTSLLGATVLSYEVGVVGFYVFLFFILYMSLSLVSLIEMVVSFGIKKAQFEYNNHSD